MQRATVKALQRIALAPTREFLTGIHAVWPGEPGSNINSPLIADLTANLASSCRQCLIADERDSLRPALKTKDQGDCLMPNTIILNPNTGAPSFGLVPGMNSRGTVIVSGEIRLLHGKHLGPNRGFGACHIWAEHTKEMEKLGFLLESDVPK